MIGASLLRRAGRENVTVVLGGLFAWLCCLAEPRLSLRTNRILRMVGALVLIVAAVIWALTGYMAYWEHLKSFSEWVPPTMR